MDLFEQIKLRIEQSFPKAAVNVVRNASGEVALAVDATHARALAMLLRDDAEIRLDYCSNVTGVDWLDHVVSRKEKVTKLVDGKEQEIELVKEERTSGYLEAVYHLYSVTHKRGPVVLRIRTADRSQDAVLPSLTPVFQSAELQEREIFDLYGIRFEGHPDLRRILMWDEFADHPMRKDYLAPDDYEYEPTPHDDILEKAKRHYSEERPCIK